VYSKNIAIGNFNDKKIEQLIKNKFTDAQWNIFNSAPELFHKYLLFLINPTDPMFFKVTKFTAIAKRYICSIHCYNLNFFSENKYGKYTFIVCSSSKPFVSK
jgi:hypothetical protein